jgi:transposase
MTVVENIRRLDSEGVPGREIARRLGVSRDSVTKYAGATDFSPATPAPAARPGSVVLAGLEPVVREWVAEDERRPRKQRHTAQRVFDRLVAEHGYAGSYFPVQRLVKQFRAEHRSRAEGFLELTWPPGQAQVDFGQGVAIIAGVRLVLHLLVVTFPFSNTRFVQAYRGETAECVCHGLRRIFEHIGSAPRVLVFDNATGVGRRTGQKVIESKLFGAFKAHYRLTARYCNPNSGNEKGNVENAVGFLRRNLMVPEPETASLGALNQMLLRRCDDLAGREHWRKGAPIGVLFAEDAAAGLELPGVGFDPVRYESRRADKTGKVIVEGVAYLAGPAYHDRHLTVGIRHDRIEILDEHAHPVIVFDRVFGHTDQTVFAAGQLLHALAVKPGAWTHSPVRDLVADPVRGWLDRAPLADRARLLARLDHATAATSFDTAIDAATQLLSVGTDPAGDGLGMLARRIHDNLEPGTTVVDLHVYDQFTHPPADTDAPETGLTEEHAA